MGKRVWLAFKVFGCLLMLSSFSVVNGQEPNAALKYWQAFAIMPQLDEQEARHFGGTPGGAYPPNYYEAPMNEVAVGLIRRCDTALNLLHRGAAISSCDWGLELSDGPHTLLPHASKARQLAGYVSLRARYHFDNERFDEGIDDVVAMMTLGRHVAADETLAGLYVQWAIEFRAIGLTAKYLPDMPHRTLRHFAQKLDSLPQGGLLKHSLAIEKEHLLGWYIDALRSDPDQTIVELFGPDAQVLETVGLANVRKQDLADNLELLQPHYDQLISLTDAPPQQRATRFVEIQQAAEEASALSQVFLSTYRHAFEDEPKVLSRMAMLQAAIDVLLNGPDSAANHQGPFGETIEYRSFVDRPGFNLSVAFNDQDDQFVIEFGAPELTWSN